MHLYRRFLQQPLLVRAVASLTWIIGFLAICQTSHDYLVHPTANRARVARSLASQWVNAKYPGDKDATVLRGELVRTISNNIDGVPIFLQGYDQPFVGAVDYEHLSWIEPSSTNIWVFTNLKHHQVRISVPGTYPISRWLNLYQSKRPIDYNRLVAVPGSTTLFTTEPLPIQTDKELALIAIAIVALDDQAFNDRMKAICRADVQYDEIDRFMESWPAHILVGTIAAVLMFLGLRSRGLDSLVRQSAEHQDLDEEHAQALLDGLLPAWLEGVSFAGIERRTQALAKNLRRRQNREADRKRREQLRLLTDEARAKKLADEAERQAKLARERMNAGQTSLGKEIAAFRKETRTRTQNKDVADVMESGFFHALTKSPDGTVSGEGQIKDENEDERETAEQVIRSCSQQLQPLDRLSDKMVLSLAERLRRVKRKLGRQEWRKLCDRFDADAPDAFVVLVMQADERSAAETKQQINKAASSRLQVVRDVATQPVPKLLDGKRVILVGGDPSISPFYVAQLELLGATVLMHHVEGNAVRMHRFKPDLVLMLFRRTDHNGQRVARSMGVTIIWLDKLSKSAFLRGAIEDIREQLA